MKMTATTKKLDNGASETPMTDKAQQLAEEALVSAAEKAGGFERKLRDESERLGEEVGERRREVSERLDETLAEVESYIRKRPVAAAGMAFAAGVLATIIIRR
ncbi:MAG: hypothetical protein P8X53_14625 [Chromatiales bacterium]|jgi:ElaB/YqjD/DUF883 family membrane-anchored ribosome-binding protein